MTETTTQTINIGDKSYNVDDLSPRVKRLIAVYQVWATDAEKQQVELAKTQAAIRDLTREIITAQAEDEAPKDEAPAA